jgi:nickel transport protein
MIFVYRAIAPVVLALLTLSNATAHEYWIDKDGRQFILNQGHKTAAHGGAMAVAYDPAIITQTHCSDEAGKTRALAYQGNPARVEGDCAAITFQLNSGYWTKTPYDTLNKPKNEVKGALQSWLAEESVTRIERWAPALAKPHAAGLQLSLPADPGRLKSGDKFTLVATLNGSPQANVAVAYDGETRGTTDTDGRINLRVRHGGLQLIAASLETPLADGKADTLIRGATLNFLLP